MGVRLSDNDEAALVAWALEAIRPGGCSGWGPEFDAALQVARRLIPYDTEGCICTETVVGKVCPVHLEVVGGWLTCTSCGSQALFNEVLGAGCCDSDPSAPWTCPSCIAIAEEGGLLGPESPSKPLSEPATTQEPSGQQTPLESPHSLEQAIKHAEQIAAGEGSCAADHRLLARWLRELHSRRADDEEIIDRLLARWLRKLHSRRAGLNENVTLAIVRAEQATGPEIAPAWMAVADAERALTYELLPTDLEGQIARRGAVRATLRAGLSSYAEYLVETYCKEKDCPDSFKLQLVAMLEDADVPRA
jgi:hypothetical protein